MLTAISPNIGIVDIKIGTFQSESNLLYWHGTNHSCDAAFPGGLTVDDINVNLVFDMSSLSGSQTQIDDINTNIVIFDEDPAPNTYIRDINTNIVILSGTVSYFENAASS